LISSRQRIWHDYFSRQARVTGRNADDCRDRFHELITAQLHILLENILKGVGNSPLETADSTCKRKLIDETQNNEEEAIAKRRKIIDTTPSGGEPSARLVEVDNSHLAGVCQLLLFILFSIDSSFFLISHLRLVLPVSRIPRRQSHPHHLVIRLQGPNH
jgi:hypothetical protein